MKILHVISQRPDSTGSGIYIGAMINQAKSSGHQNSLVAGVEVGKQPPSPFNDCQMESYITFGSERGSAEIEHQIVGMSDIMPYPSKTFHSMGTEEVENYCAVFSRKLERIVEVFSPDIIHSHHLWIVTSLVGQLFPDLPLVTTCHGTDLRQFIQCTHLQSLVLAGCQEVNTVFALSELQKREITTLYSIQPENIVVVGGGYDTLMFHHTFRKRNHIPQILYAGKLSKSKGVPSLLHCLEKLDEIPFHLHLVGSSSGEELEVCLRLAEKLAEKVTVYGSVPQAKVAELMQLADLFVFPSFFEGLPLVILEALACECLVIANDLPGVQEILTKTGSERLIVLDMPAMHSIDTPVPTSLEQYQERLRQSVSEQVIAIARNPKHLENRSPGNLSFYSWQEVFKRVAREYDVLVRQVL